MSIGCHQRPDQAEVKVYLNGVRSMQRIANWSMLIVKILGTILSVSCLLAVGQGK